MGHRKDRRHSSSSSKRHKHSSKVQERGDPDPSDAARVLKYASLGKARKLRKLADRQDTALLNTYTDSRGATALHQAARHGHLEVVQLLLR
jgi:ankyrin repeat protein